ncbi:hypothetical protein ACFL27_20245 [candidate division CSSED10-310 bacterium]|uniref:IPTL-CTERM sorting domain-containing protein n=1 Tax=candidate division CSSED10-310 bacterium TaxID=2855610 RepID=A0ABV6Z254_UNCC1
MTSRLILQLTVFIAVIGFNFISGAVPVGSPDLPPQSECATILRYYESNGPLQYTGPVNTFVFADPVHRCWSNVNVSNVGPDEHEQFDSIFQADFSIDGGPSTPGTLMGPVLTITYGKADNTTGTFQAEIVEMALSGEVGGLPVLIRESPSQASAGQVTITDIGGGFFEIDSFFDVFTELSVDGGQSWLPQDNSPTRLTYTITTLVPVSVPDLPPESECSQTLRLYQGADPLQFTNAQGTIVFTDPVLRCWSNVIRTNVGPDEEEDFDALFHAGVSIYGDLPQAVTLAGPVVTMTQNKVGYTTGTFQSEIVEMTLVGERFAGYTPIPVMIRESLVQTSSGEVTITELGSGLYGIASFFDVFTELSIDGGQTWIPQDNSPTKLVYTKVISVPVLNYWSFGALMMLLLVMACLKIRGKRFFRFFET